MITVIVWVSSTLSQGIVVTIGGTGKLRDLTVKNFDDISPLGHPSYQRLSEAPSDLPTLSILRVVENK